MKLSIFGLIAVVFAFTSQIALAETYTKTCSLVDAFDDWSVRVGPKQVDFFDNDSNCEIGLSKKKGSVATYAKMGECNFDSVRFVINHKKMTAYLYFPKGLKDENGKKIKKLPMYCEDGAYQD